MAVAAYIISSVMAFVVGLVAYVFAGAGLVTALVIYLGGSILLGTVIVGMNLLLGKLLLDGEPEAQTSF